MTALQAELDFTLELVRECGEIAMRYWRGGTRVMALREKPLGGGPITLADTELNDRIVHALSRRFPDDGIVAEESIDQEASHLRSRCWFVDPIDGTREFARGRTGWTIQVGLCLHGQPVLGVVYEPAAGHLSWAIHTEHYTVARHKAPGTEEIDLRLAPTPFESLILIGGRLYPMSQQHDIRRALRVTPDRAQSVGSVGVRLASVARGDATAYVQAPGHTKMWDTCAPSVLVLAGGGRVTDLVGDPLDFQAANVTHPRGVVASPTNVHSLILKRVAPLVDRWL